MIHPTLDELLKHADNRFTVAVVAAKRARQIIDEEQKNEERTNKAVTVALEEMVKGTTKYQRTKSGVK